MAYGSRLLDAPCTWRLSVRDVRNGRIPQLLRDSILGIRSFEDMLLRSHQHHSLYCTYLSLLRLLVLVLFGADEAYM